MTVNNFLETLKKTHDSKTLYILGCFGAPMNDANKKRYSTNCDYNRERADLINAATPDTFGFDCSGLIKGALWGWSGDMEAQYGGAVYESSGVPDDNADTMISKCKDVSEDFSTIVPGEMLWIKGHAGVYIGDGLAVECTPRWDDSVQYTAVSNLGKVAGYHSRKWTKHGKLPYIEYKVDDDTDSLPFSVGQTVKFMGSRCYAGADAGMSVPCKPGVAVVTSKAPGEPHPYKLRRTANGGSSVDGWVDASDVEAYKPTTYVEPTTRVEPTTYLIKRGNYGATVRAMQALLNDRGARLDIDGKFGEGTESALRAFQRDMRLTADGVCGAKTWTALLSV